MTAAPVLTTALFASLMTSAQAAAIVRLDL